MGLERNVPKTIQILREDCTSFEITPPRQSCPTESVQFVFNISVTTTSPSSTAFETISIEIPKGRSKLEDSRGNEKKQLSKKTCFLIGTLSSDKDGSVWPNMLQVLTFPVEVLHFPGEIVKVQVT
ncbi:hypothetical protein BLNAU_13250 [Blattamonas nauphoetae]|uniref:Uncharacterized protein n=1 Tax=Blattamonas nauphoetae TaxID=2049346 RepID=A0ABQ9XH21_9EUKA|nr:hypothetical protein BLNAU_13250 [Blattamonas nauphoetae]